MHLFSLKINPQLEDIKVAFNSFIENMKEKLE